MKVLQRSFLSGSFARNDDLVWAAIRTHDMQRGSYGGRLILRRHQRKQREGCAREVQDEAARGLIGIALSTCFVDSAMLSASRFPQLDRIALVYLPEAHTPVILAAVCIACNGAA